MSGKKTVSELEGCVLGIVWAQGPCTAYLIRREFLDSLSPYWSGSSGAIYPLVDRLERRGLIRSVERKIGRKRSKHYALTAAGRKMLLSWLKPLPDLVIGVPPDPLRTRIEFLDVLSRREKATFIADARARMRTHLRKITEQANREQTKANHCSYLVLRGSIGILKSRLQWLNEVNQSLLD